MRPVVHEGQLSGQGFRFAIVASRWNDFISSRLVDGALNAFESLGVAERDVEIYKVPGAFEIPTAVRVIASSRRPDVVVTLGALIRGETPHFDSYSFLPQN